MRSIPAIAPPRTHVGLLAPPDGHVGLVPWSILRVGDNLRVAIGQQEIEISTLKELAQVQQLFEAVTAALAEVVLR